MYTDGSKSGEKVAAAAVIEQQEFKCRLADNASIFTAELKGIELALSEIETTQGEDFVIFSDSMSSLHTGIGRRWLAESNGFKSEGETQQFTNKSW